MRFLLVTAVTVGTFFEGKRNICMKAGSFIPPPRKAHTHGSPSSSSIHLVRFATLGELLLYFYISLRYKKKKKKKKKEKPAPWQKRGPQSG